jgi:hypothetical protein
MIFAIWQESRPRSTIFGLRAAFARTASDCRAQTDGVRTPATEAPMSPPAKVPKVFRLDIAFLVSRSIISPGFSDYSPQQAKP